MFDALYILITAINVRNTSVISLFYLNIGTQHIVQVRTSAIYPRMTPL